MIDTLSSTSTPAPKRDGHATAVLTVDEAAAYLGVKRMTLYRMMRAGEIPHTKIRRSVRLRIADLEGCLTARTSTTWTPDPRGGTRPTARATRAAEVEQRSPVRLRRIEPAAP